MGRREHAARATAEGELITTPTATYNVPDISCDHCKHAIESEVAQLPGIDSVDVDVRARTVTVVAAQLDGPAIVAAIDEAGYDVVGEGAIS